MATLEDVTALGIKFILTGSSKYSTAVGPTFTNRTEEVFYPSKFILCIICGEDTDQYNEIDGYFQPA
jgi:hypothetical protein